VPPEEIRTNATAPRRAASAHIDEVHRCAESMMRARSSGSPRQTRSVFLGSETCSE